MTRILFVSFISVFLVSCNKSKKSTVLSEPLAPETIKTENLPEQGNAAPVPAAPVLDVGTTPGGSTTGGTTTSGLPNQAYTFDTNVLFFNVTPTQEAKFNKALDIIKSVVATEEFRNRIINFTYAGKKAFVDNGGYTNEQIYQIILDGAEKLQSSKDNEMDMEVELYTAATTTVGYTYPNSKRIWVNTKYFNQYTSAGVAHNLFHEWLHKLGFAHAASYSTARDSSVPYAIGDIVGDIGKDFL